MDRMFSPNGFLVVGIVLGVLGFLTAASTHNQSFMNLGYVIMEGFLSAAFIVGATVLRHRKE